MDFDQSFTRLLGHEGGYSNNAADGGGETMWGITVAVARENNYTGNMRDLPRGIAALIYRRKYWDAVRADELPETVKFDVFDGAVNSGVSQSIKWLQQAAGTTPDGVIGPATIAAAHALPASISKKYNGMRLQFMTNLPNWNSFSRGWARRIASNLLV